MGFIENYLALCEKAGKKPTTVLGEMGVSKSAWTKWQRGSMPDGKTLQKLALYFGVPTDLILSEDGIENAAPTDEDGDVWAIRENMRRRPGLKLLFDALEDVPDSQLYETLAYIAKLKEQSRNDAD